jgi:hypothetical protein
LILSILMNNLIVRYVESRYLRVMGSSESTAEQPD